MPKYVIERNIPGAGNMSADELCAVSQKSNSVLKGLTGEGKSVQWVESYVSDDAIHCVYVASDADVVREHAQRGGFPADRIFAVQGVIDPTTGE